MNDELEYLTTLHALHALEPNEVPKVQAYLETDSEAYANYVQHLETCAKLARLVAFRAAPPDLMPRILENIRGNEVKKCARGCKKRDSISC